MGTCRCLGVVLLVVASFLGVARAARAQQPGAPAPLAVRVTNRSEPVLCAEKDNVAVMLQSSEVQRFAIEAAHPVYIHSLQRDAWEADWTDCDMRGDPAVAAQPRVVTLYESDELALIGHTVASFWRKNDATFRVGERVEQGLHLVQLWVGKKGKRQEVIAVYPPDGYWRARPLPPPQLAGSAYGSSFIIGPVESEAGRPVANLSELAFDPATKTFSLRYRDGSTGTLRLAALDDNRLVMEVELARKGSRERPFAALRSMYVTEFNADVARIAVRAPSEKGWLEDNIMHFSRAQATEVWAGRLIPSRHNTSAPDMVFRRFAR